VLWSIVEDGARRGLAECQKVFNSNRWSCPVEMYKKLPIFNNKTFPYGESDVLSFAAFFTSKTVMYNNTFINVSVHFIFELFNELLLTISSFGSFYFGL